MREKVGKPRNTAFFQWFGGSGGSKSRLAKAAGAEPAGHRWARWKIACAVVARSTFPSQNVQNTPASDHFWKLRCRKSARRCGAKHISKSKSVKNWRSRTTFGSWDVEKVHAVVARSTFRSRKCTKHTGSRTTFGSCRCRKSARRCGAKHISKSKCYKTHRMLGPLLEVQMSLASLHYTTLHYTTLHYTTLHSTTLQLQLHKLNFELH